MPDLYVCGFTRVAYVLRHAEIRVQGYIDLKKKIYFYFYKSAIVSLLTKIHLYFTAKSFNFNLML